MASRRPGTQSRVVGGQGFLGPAKTPTPRTRPPAMRPPLGRNGIVISLGPSDHEDTENEYITAWMTFPVTPEAIPMQFGAQHTDGRFTVEGGERSQYVGRMLRATQFAGRLEPPQFYYPTGSRSIASAITGGEMHGPAAIARSFDISPNVRTSGRYAYPVPYNQGGTSVVMEDGAHPGPSHYVEPHAFAGMLAGAAEDGEVVRLVIGDQYGWNFLATIRDFTPRFEDPDPDVLMFEITFREWRRDVLRRVGKGKSKGKSTYTTKHGDTLHIIAASELGGSSKWGQIARLNRSVLAKLWYYPDLNTLGPKIHGKAGTQFSKSGKGSHVPPTMKFRSGVTLKLKQSKKSKGKRK